MKVVFLNSTDSGGGAAIAAVRLLDGVRDHGVDAQMLVQRKFTDNSSVVCTAANFGSKWASARTLLDFVPVKLYPNRNRFIFSPAHVPELLNRKIAISQPDIVHLHWLGEGFLRLESLARFGRPMIWTLHDSWPFTGGCHIPFDCTKYREMCGCCPTLGSNCQYDLSRMVWRRKERIYPKLNLTIVSPSRWLARCAESSSLLRGVPVKIIPNGLDLERFRPMDQAHVRNVLGLPQDRRLILFGAIDCTSDKNKGFHLLQSALQRLVATGWSEKADLLVFGSPQPVNPPDLGLTTHYLGQIDDVSSIASIYSAADLFVAPSIQENLSNMVMEAMACGTPSVAFDIGGMPDLIEHKYNGYLARPYEVDDLADGIAWGLSDGERLSAMSQRCREKVSEYAIQSVSQRYLDLYRNVITEGSDSNNI